METVVEVVVQDPEVAVIAAVVAIPCCIGGYSNRKNAKEFWESLSRTHKLL
tara:strand:- start:155 stop:307 length:153 start_codon:yes stop_codon:yes gene_type:complete